MWRSHRFWLPLTVTVAAALLLAACSPSRSGSKAGAKATAPQTTAPEAAPEPLSAADKPIADWLAASAIPLKSLTAGSGFDDLQPMKERLKGARVIALGDATYGTHESETTKQRLVEFLVKELGVKAVLLEATYPETLALNQCVLSRCDTANALTAGYWFWQTKEMVALTEWMQSYNQTAGPADRVQVLGYDFQSPQSTWDVQTFLKDVDPTYAAQLQPMFEQIQEDWYVITGQRTVPDQSRTPHPETWPDQVNGLVTYLEQHEQPLVKATSAERYTTTLALARNLRRYVTFKVAPAAEKGALSSRYKAESVQELLKGLGPDAKVVLWANNVSVAASDGTMGGVLRTALGDQYYALGVAFNRGSFRAFPMENGKVTGPVKAFTVGPAPTGQLEWYLAGSGLGNSLIDFHQGEKSAPVQTWLTQPRPIRSIAPLYSTQTNTTMPIAPKAFDGLIYIPETTPSVSFR